MSEIVKIDGDVAVTTTLAIAEGTENEHASVIALVRRYQADLEEFGHVDFKSEMVSRPQGGGAPREMALLNEQQSTLLLTYMRNTDIVRKFKKALVREFYNMAQHLRSARERAQPGATLTGELAIADCFVRWLRPSPSSQVAMLGSIAQRHGLDSSYLPAYVIDAPADVAGGSSMATAPISQLLKENRIGAQAHAYNELLINAGMLERRTRKSTSKRAVNGEKKFLCITERGLRYGKNVTSPESPRETQPHWYVERFTELHKIVAGRLLVSNAVEPRRYGDVPANASIAKREAV